MHFILLIITIPLFHAFHRSISIYHPNQVGSAFVTLLAGSEAETGNAGTICVQDFGFQIYMLSPIFQCYMTTHL